VWLDGLRFHPRSPRHAISGGLAYLPENRILDGLVPTMRVPLNATMAIWSQLTGLLGYFRTAQMQRRTVELVDRVELQAGRIGQLVRTLSGGNQQKVVLAKWLAAEPQVLILDEPTHGIDIGTKPEILRIVAELAATGVGIIFISSELEEVLAMSTRVLVMREGRLVAEFASPADRERVMQAASGVEAPPIPV
jgi:rhamnose transport system ATP-binding protein